MNNLIWLVVGATLATLVALVISRNRPSARRHDEVSLAQTTDLAELNRDKRRSSEIIERMVEGVVVLNEALTPVLANSSARALLGLPEEDLPMRLATEEVIDIARRALDGQDSTEEVVEVWFPSRMSLRVHAAPLEDRGVVVVLGDVTQELLTQRIRREFAASASHELKSPVASIQALAEALQDAARHDPEVTIRFADKIVVEAQRLARLTTSLIDLSRLEEAAEAPKEICDTSRVIAEVVEALQETIEEADVEFHHEVEPHLLVRGDDSQLTLMVRNLLENALRYTPSGGRVSISGRSAPPQILLKVSDTGIGIPESSRERIFERFYRVDPGRSRDLGGTGLGLAIVKHVVERHGGRIDLESEVGEGSTFLVTLPALPAEQTSQERPTERIA